MRDLLFVLLLGYGDVSRDAILARSLANYFVRPLACARLEARRVRDALSFSPLLCLSLLVPLLLSVFPRGDLPCRLFSFCLSFSLSFATLSPYNRTPPFARFSLFLLSSPRETRHIFSYTSASSPCNSNSAAVRPGFSFSRHSLLSPRRGGSDWFATSGSWTAWIVLALTLFRFLFFFFLLPGQSRPVIVRKGLSLSRSRLGEFAR